MAAPTSTPAETVGGHDPRPAPVEGPAFLLRGDVVGRYVVLDKLGSGGMGIVYAAYDPELDRKVALKLIRPGVRGKAEVARARLLREAQALARLNHPGVIAVHDVGTYEDQVFVAMEFVDGPDLAHWLRQATRPWREVLPIMRQAGEGLAAAHAAGVIHRDFKPENVLIGSDGRVRVLDFGLARTAGADAIERGDVHDDRPQLAGLERISTIGTTVASVRLTQAGALLGTPAYMAPEQHLGGNVDARTDQFAFCIALYEALWGERPFAGDTPAAIAYEVTRGKIREAPRDTLAVPSWLRRVILRGLAVEPDARWHDMRELLAALAADPATRQRRIAYAALALGLVGAGGLALSAVEPDEGACRGAERRLEGVWDDGVRQAVETAFTRSQAPYAADALASTATQLDAYTTRFVALHTDACEATAIRREQSQDMLDRQMACLDRRLKDVRALTRLLASADDPMVARAPEAAGALPALEPCADREALVAGAPPITGEAAAQIAELEDQLAEATQQFLLARYTDALATATGAESGARALGNGHLQAEALLVRGRAELQLGKGAAAEASMNAATWTADAAGDDRTRASAFASLTFAAAESVDRAAEVERLSQAAQATLTRLGGDPMIEAELHNNLGVAARRRGDAARAVTEHELALALRRGVATPDETKIADSLMNLGLSLVDAGQLEQADRTLAEAEPLIRKYYGESHPRFASFLHTRGFLRHRRGDDGSAAELLARATALRDAVLPRGHPDVAKSHHDLGEVLLAARRFDEARAQFEVAVALRTPGRAGDPRKLANSLTGRGKAELGLGQLEVAAASLRAALELWPTAERVDRSETGFALAQATWADDHATALGLARTALDEIGSDVGETARAAEIRAWIAQHDAR